MLNAYIIADKIRITPIKLKKYTVEPPVSDEPKLQRLSGRLPEVVAYKDRTTGANGGGGHLPRRGLGTSTLWKIIYCMQFTSYTACSSMLLLKLFAYSK